MRTIIFYLLVLMLFFYSIAVSAQAHVRTNSLAVRDSMKVGNTWLTENDVKSLKPPSRGVDGYNLSRDQFYKELNLIREQYGYRPLKKAGYLEMKAEIWLGFLKRHDLGMVHDTSTTDGEVLTNAYQYLTWWMNSPRHKAVLLGKKWKRIGLAEKNGVYCARLN